MEISDIITLLLFISEYPERYIQRTIMIISFVAMIQYLKCSDMISIMQKNGTL